MLDFNFQSLLSDRICFLVDAANDVCGEPHRSYLGCSAIGGECERAVYCEYAGASAVTSQSRGCLGPTGRPEHYQPTCPQERCEYSRADTR